MDDKRKGKEKEAREKRGSEGKGGMKGRREDYKVRKRSKVDFG